MFSHKTLLMVALQRNCKNSVSRIPGIEPGHRALPCTSSIDDISRTLKGTTQVILSDALTITQSF